MTKMLKKNSKKFWERIVSPFNYLKKIISNCILCIRFNFLYVRNRFNDRHITNLLGSKLRNLYQDTYHQFQVTASLGDPKEPLVEFHKTSDNIVVFLYKDDEDLLIYNNYTLKKIDLTKLLWGGNKFKIKGMRVYKSGYKTNITIYVDTIDQEDKNRYGFHYEHYEIVVDPDKERMYNFLNWVDEKILDRLCFIPTHNELDAMEPGWRKAFGIQMCKELKAQLKKDKWYKDFRIMQIKEKWGGLRFYVNAASKEVYDIISKYEVMSHEICGHCGKPATKISGGWIYPYCDECYEKYHKDQIPYQVKEDNIWKYSGVEEDAKDEEEI